MEQVIIGGSWNALHVTTTEYTIVCGRYSWSSTVDNRAQVISTPGTLKRLRVELNDVPGTGTYVFTLHRAVGLGAWANTALTCTVAADGTTASDLVNEVAVAAGDVFCLECNPDNPDNARYARWTMVFEGDNAKESLLPVFSSLNTTVTFYCGAMGGALEQTENDIRQVCPTSGVIKDLYIQSKRDPSTGSYTITLRIDGVNSDDGEGNPLQVVLAAGNRTGNDTTHEIDVSAGDVLTISMVESAPATFGDIVAIGMTFVADTDGESLILGGSYDDLHNTNTEYNFLLPWHGTAWSATETERYQLAQECTLKKLHMLLSDSPGADNDYTFTVRLEGASPGGGLVVEIADAATTGNDTTNSIAVSDGNTVNMMVVPTGTPTVRDAYWGLVCYIAVAVSVEITVPSAAATDGASLTPTLIRDRVFTASLATIAGASLLPTVHLGTTITATLATIASTSLTPTLIRDRIFTPPLTTIAGASLTPTLIRDRIFSAPLTTIAGASLAPIIEISAIIIVPLTTIDGASLTPTLIRDMIFTAPLTTIAGASLTPTLIRDVIFDAPLTTIAGATLTPSMILDIILDVPLTTIDVASLTPSLIRDMIFSAPLTTIDGASLIPTLIRDRIFSAPLTTIEGATLTPSMILDMILTAPLTNIDLASINPDIRAMMIVLRSITLKLHERDLAVKLFDRDITVKARDTR